VRENQKSTDVPVVQEAAHAKSVLEDKEHPALKAFAEVREPVYLQKSHGRAHAPMMQQPQRLWTSNYSVV